MKISPRMELIKYAIRDIVVVAKEVEKKKKLYYFNIGDPNKFDFDTPDFFKRALVEAINDKRNNGYTESAGNIILRKAICERQKRLWGTDLDPDNVLVTTGVSEAISFIGNAVEAGTKMLVPSPLYPSYLSYFKVNGINPLEYSTLEEENWQPDTDHIRRLIDNKTEAILIINPNNPTGSVYSEKTVKEICDIAGEHDLLVISDEIYDLLTWDGKFRSTTSLTDVPVLELNGISKTLFAPGWRLGWAILRDYDDRYSDLWKALAKQSRIRLCANSPIQQATSKILNQDMIHLPEIIEKLKSRANYFTKRINEMDQFSLTPPSGAFYAFPKINIDIDDKEFIIDILRNTGILFVFGSGFGEAGKGHFRSVILPDLSTMEEALNILEDYLNKHYN